MQTKFILNVKKLKMKLFLIKEEETHHFTPFPNSHWWWQLHELTQMIIKIHWKIPQHHFLYSFPDWKVETKISFYFVFFFSFIFPPSNVCGTIIAIEFLRCYFYTLFQKLYSGAVFRSKNSSIVWKEFSQWYLLILEA